MPRVAEMKELTPFAAVLVDYMWNRRRPNQRPLTTSQLAVRLGVPRQSVNNWIYSGNIPPLEAVFAVLAKLDIPMRALYDAYRLSGLPVPRWDEHDTSGPYQDQAGRTFTEHTKKPTTIPIEDIPTLSPSIGATRGPEPLPYTPPPPRDPAQEVAEEWDTLIKQTSAALRAEGMSQASVDAVIRSLRARQAGQTIAERQIQAEHQEGQQTQESQEAEPSEPSEPQTSETRETKRRGQPTAK